MLSKYLLMPSISCLMRERKYKRSISVTMVVIRITFPSIFYWPKSKGKLTFFLSLIDPFPRTMILHPVSCSSCLVVIPRGPRILPTKLNWKKERNQKPQNSLRSIEDYKFLFGNNLLWFCLITVHFIYIDVHRKKWMFTQNCLHGWQVSTLKDQWSLSCCEWDPPAVMLTWPPSVTSL